MVLEYTHLLNNVVIEMLKQLSLYTLLLCVVPFFTWSINWRWNGSQSYSYFDTFLYFLTETGSMPYAIVICIILCIAYFFCISNKKQAIIAICIMIFSIGVTQCIKSALKMVFAEPRPFIVELAEKSSISTEYFYDCSRQERKQIVLDYYKNIPQRNTYLAYHHSRETGYSFPSGHSILVATWLMLSVGFYQLLGNKNRRMKALTVGITVWAILILISRLRLGMHYPIDLLASVLIAWVFHCGLFLWLDKKAIFSKDSVC